jgi:hypothetical protein
MEIRVGQVVVHYVEHGTGRPVLVLHGAGVDHYPRSSLAVIDDAGHALPHEQPELLRALLAEWLTRVERLR